MIVLSSVEEGNFAERRQTIHEQISKKGPFIQEALLKRVQEMNKTGDQEGPQDLVARQHHLPGFHWPYGCRP